MCSGSAERRTDYGSIDTPVLPRILVPFRRQPGLGKRLLTQTEEIGLPLGLCFLGCVGLGLGYLLEPQGGPQRRARLREKGRA
jgi:hypothetical protein